MSRTTGIEWTDATWSPLRVRVKLDAAEIARAKGYTSLIQIVEKTAGQPGQHCEHVSEGCKHCYSETWQGRCLKVNGTGLPFDRRSRDLVEPFVDSNILEEPRRWCTQKRVFVENQSDLFGEWWSFDDIDRVLSEISGSRRHTFQILTKRPLRMLSYFARFRSDGQGWMTPGGEDACQSAVCVEVAAWPLPNLILGVSVEDQDTANLRYQPMKDLSERGWKTFVSYEPALGPVLFFGWGFLDWLIAGGESGPGARPPHPDWFRSARDQCVAAGVPFFFKQWGDVLPAMCDGALIAGQPQVINSSDEPIRIGKKKAGALLDGREWKQFPGGIPLMSTATKTATPNDPIWRQVEGELHRWELARLSDNAILATIWFEGDWWQWSVPGHIPERGMRRKFREAADEATKKAASR